MKGFSLGRSVQRATSLSPHVLLLSLVAILATLLFAQQPAAGIERGGAIEGTPSFLPMMMLLPTPTPAPLPQVVGEIPLPGAACPHYINVNPTTGYAYIANSGSSNVSIVQEDSLLATVHTGEWPSHISSDPNSARTFVSNLHADTTVFNGLNVVTSLPPALEPFDVVYNGINDLIYTTDPHVSTIRIYDGLTYQILTDISLGAGSPVDAGWVLDLEVDTNTGLTYAAGFPSGLLFTLDGTAVVKTTQLGVGMWEMAFDPVTNLLYITHYETVNPYNITVARDGEQVATYDTAGNSFDVAVNPLTGYAYFTNRDNNSLTILQRGELVGTIPVGEKPSYVAVNPNTGYVFVANANSDTVTVLKGTDIVATYPTGDEPYAVAVDAVRNITYVVNRASYVVVDEVGREDTVCEAASVTVLR